MISTKLASIGLAASLVAILPAIAAQAAGRTFVSAAGNDSNPCTITLPCRNLQAAYNAVAANGQVDVLDPGNYGSLTITGPVNIQGHGWAGLSAPTGAAITINAAGATNKIAISGVVLDGLGITGTTGIRFNSGGSLNVRDSVIRNFGKIGIDFEPNGASQIYISNTLVSENGDDGIKIFPLGSGTTNGVLSHVEMQDNLGVGLEILTNTQTITITVSDCVSANNGSSGVSAAASTPVNVMVRNSTIATNGFLGLFAQDAGATIRVTRSTIAGNFNAWAILTGGTVLSYDDNNIDNNGANNSTPGSPIPYR